MLGHTYMHDVVMVYECVHTSTNRDVRDINVIKTVDKPGRVGYSLSTGEAKACRVRVLWSGVG
jgi:hypothetical protein